MSATSNASLIRHASEDRHHHRGCRGHRTRDRSQVAFRSNTQTKTKTGRHRRRRCSCVRPLRRSARYHRSKNMDRLVTQTRSSWSILKNLPGDVRPGEESAATGAASGQFIEKAVELWRSGTIAAIATAPISKKALNAGGYDFPGHTEFLAQLTDTTRFRDEFFRRQAARRSALDASFARRRHQTRHSREPRVD